MTRLSTYLTDDHDHCDRLFADAENAVAAADKKFDKDKNWASALGLFDAFQAATLAHFTREEVTLFPAFETRTGMSGGPTYIMREEHAQMREVLSAMADALQQQNATRYLGLSETLLMLMRQHNLKEEQILYPMCDQALSDQAATLLEEMSERSG